MKTLYIIGNGFDKAHNLRTDYEDFCVFLERSKFLNAIDFAHAIEPIINGVKLWKEFEKALGAIDPIDFIDYRIKENQFDQPAKDFVEEANITYGDTEYIQRGFYEELIEAFGEWARHINTDGASKLKCRHFSSEDYYFTFNYTDTLEKVYGIPSPQVQHIHGDAKKAESIIVVGHNHDYHEEITAISRHLEEKLPGDLGDTSNALVDLLNSSQKDVSGILRDHNRYFRDLSNKSICRIVVIGHSYGEVDWPYFREINQRCPKAHWVLECYTEGDKVSARRMNKKLGLCAAIKITNEQTLSTCYHNFIESVKSYLQKYIKQRK